MIIPIYKPLGESTHLLAKKVGDLFQEKATHTGTLDPMASGVVVVLTGQDRFRKQELSTTKKTYKFQALVGISTDSLDKMGLITHLENVIHLDDTNQNQEEVSKEISQKIERVLPEFLGETLQTVPKFSARRMKGQSSFDLAKKNKEIEPKQEAVHIWGLELTDWHWMTAHQVLELHEQQISQVEGDFRQQQIIENWQQKFSNQNQNQFLILSFKATVSKRTYIRGIIRDLSQKIGIPLTTWSIERTQVGEHSIQDCICLV